MAFIRISRPNPNRGILSFIVHSRSLTPSLWMQRRHWALEVLRREGVRSVSQKMRKHGGRNATCCSNSRIYWSSIPTNDPRYSILAAVLVLYSKRSFSQHRRCVSSHCVKTKLVCPRWKMMRRCCGTLRAQGRIQIASCLSA